MEHEPDDKVTSPASAPEKQPFAIWLRANWGWAAVLAAGIVLIAASIFFVASVLIVPASPAPDASPTPPGDRTPVPVDIETGPTTTPAVTAPPGVAEQTSDSVEGMVLVPAGPFRMGTTDDELAQLYALCDPILGADACRRQGFEEELPAHEVTLDAYYIDFYEVTNAEYAAFLNEMSNQSGGGVQWYEAGDQDARLQFTADQWQSVPAYADHPATEATWYGARAYCEWRGGRLPTEAEWEKAARWNPASGEVNIYPWGPTQPTAAEANFAMTGTGTRPVGSFEAGKSPLGLYDAAGNVFEWVEDWFQPGGYNLEQADNPQGPADGTLKVIRGGSWGDNAFFLRTANRGTLVPTSALNFVGFRCAMDAGE